MQSQKGDINIFAPFALQALFSLTYFASMGHISESFLIL